ncbi:MAG: MerR family transcriptional regulator [Fusobacteriaceae bacterium]
MFNEFITIGEIASFTNIPISTLRYYDKIGVLSPAYKNNDTKYRYYTSKQIIILKIINHMRNMGFSIQYIKSHFDNMDYSHTLALFEKVLFETKLEIKKLKLAEKELIESCNKFKESFEIENKIGIPFIQEIEEIKGVIFDQSVNSFIELRKSLDSVNSFEKANNFHHILRGFKMSFDGWNKNKFQKEALIVKMKETEANVSIIIPKGKYVSVYGKGIFEEENIVQNLLTWIKNNNLKPKEEFFAILTDLILFKSKKDFQYLLRIPVF